MPTGSPCPPLCLASPRLAWPGLASPHLHPEPGQCLSGPEFKRCALDTLWYVTGKPGAYQLHHRKVDEVEDELCLDKINCHLPESATRLGSCKHCGAKKWNILGDQESGYVLSEDGGKVGAAFRGFEAAISLGECDMRRGHAWSCSAKPTHVADGGGASIMRSCTRGRHPAPRTTPPPHDPAALPPPAPPRHAPTCLLQTSLTSELPDERREEGENGQM